MTRSKMYYHFSDQMCNICCKARYLVRDSFYGDTIYLNEYHLAKKNLATQYSWITCQLEVGITLAFLLSRSNFKSEASFGFLSPNYTGHVT